MEVVTFFFLVMSCVYADNMWNSADNTKLAKPFVHTNKNKNKQEWIEDAVLFIINNIFSNVYPVQYSQLQ